MHEQEILTNYDEFVLSEAFPTSIRSTALLAGQEIKQILADGQWSERFAVNVGKGQVLIPARLRFAEEVLAIPKTESAWLVARALQTRSFDGFERQRAVNDLIPAIEEWTAPFIVALIGEYVVEILQDIEAKLSPRGELVLATFVADNAAFWATTKQRVASYWNVYYRKYGSFNSERGFSRSEYVGFDLIKRLEKAATSMRNTAV